MHPVTEGREAGPAWVPRWRFRLILLLLLAIGVAVVIIGYHFYSGAGSGTKIHNIPQASQHLRWYVDDGLGS